jgi:hypothetical protein
MNLTNPTFALSFETFRDRPTDRYISGQSDRSALSKDLGTRPKGM